MPDFDFDIGAGFGDFFTYDDGGGADYAAMTEAADNNVKETARQALPPVCVCVSPVRVRCRRIFGLREGVPADLPELRSGDAVHFITGGEQGAMLFLDIILRQCPRLDHLLISTWTVFEKDARRLAAMVEDGTIGRLDLLAGDVQLKTPKRATGVLTRLAAEHENVRFQITACHAKVFAGCGGGFYFGIQCSANLSAHHRTEQGSIICMPELYKFYTKTFEPLFDENGTRADPAEG